MNEIDQNMNQNGRDDFEEAHYSGLNAKNVQLLYYAIRMMDMGKVV